jgi:hypothetical protein
MRLARADSDEDGDVTKEEFTKMLADHPSGSRGGRGGPPSPRGARGPSERGPATLLGLLDKDADGKITQSEMVERAKALHAKADADGDGTVTREEFVKAIASRRGPGRGSSGIAYRGGGPWGRGLPQARGGRGGFPHRGQMGPPMPPWGRGGPGFGRRGYGGPPWAHGGPGSFGGAHRGGPPKARGSRGFSGPSSRGKPPWMQGRSGSTSRGRGSSGGPPWSRDRD